MANLSTSESEGTALSIIARILIADDVPSHRELLRSILEVSGYQVDEAEDGEQVVARAPTFSPDLVILDLDMPKMNGCQAAIALRRLPAFEKTPIVALTASLSKMLAEEFEQAGFNEYLLKPVGPAQLRQCVMALL